MNKDLHKSPIRSQEKNYVTIQPKATKSEMYVNSTGQIVQNAIKAYPVGLYQHKDPEESIIRRTRSLIPQSVKCQIVQMAQDNPRITQGDIAQMFGIDRTTVSKILKRRHKFLEESKEGIQETETIPPKITKLDDVLNQHICSYMETWYVDAKKRNKFITQSMVKDEANTVARGYGATSLSLSDDWFRDFFNRHGVREPDIEDLVKKEFEDPSSSDDLILKEPQTDDYIESPPKAVNLNRGKLGTRVSHTVTSQDATLPKPTSSASPSLSCPIPRHQGNKIPKVQTETADTTRDDLVDIQKDIEELETNEALKREMGNLEKFREQQKMIEEANKQKKALLSKTLSERQRKAQEEARKLSHIQREVAILDNLLTADVNVIRSRIELASREFLDAQRRYDRAEKEFVESKLDLQKKSELKEHLTEHLYTIIHQNEVRKAEKLSELMKELDMEQPSDSPILQSLPPLSSFNTMSSADTLHSPTKSHPPETKHLEPSHKPDTESGSSNSTSSSKDVDSVQESTDTTAANVTKSSQNNVDESSSKPEVPTQQTSVSVVKTSTGTDSEKSSAIVKQTSNSSVVNLTESKENPESQPMSSTTSDSSATKKNLISIQPITIEDDEGSLSPANQENASSENMPSAWTLEVVKNS